jgi:hypothetical protein
MFTTIIYELEGYAYNHHSKEIPNDYPRKEVFSLSMKYKADAIYSAETWTERLIKKATDGMSKVTHLTLVRNNNTNKIVYNKIHYTTVAELSPIESVWDYPEIIEVLNKFSAMENTYENCEQLIKELEPLGFTIEYGLDAIPYNVKRIPSSKLIK